MKRACSRIAYALGEFFLLTFFALLPFIAVYLDAIVIGNNLNEFSVTEISQETLLLLTAIIFWYGTWQHPDSRGFFALAGGFFTCALIRESDSFLDAIWHGFWVWPATILSLSTVFYVVIYCQKSVIKPASEFIGTKPYLFIVIGLVTLLVLSRTLGSGNLLWNEILEEAYTQKFKSILQEGLELFGYVNIAYGSVLLFFKRYNP
ncbi:hypothetical protein Q5L94_08785 [Idiomarina sp. Sol25]|uniref:hypothetical protein n=1 Tax=Idiomarina sp. Sol25 TaxID=3064000 RepID=UPI00294AF6DD|nr:hypothetical protein [Idiomarina sp. Sol25]MDV6328153.1 hypothetical protein [Idiomarina sp. Sol25]